MNTEIIIKKNVDKFVNRFWKAAIKTFCFYIILLILPLFNIHGDYHIYLMWWGLILILIMLSIRSYRRWTINAITSITMIDATFKIEFFHKDLKQVCIINKSRIQTILSWETGRPRVLKLSVFDGELKIMDLYSAGNRKNEYFLEDIALRMKCGE
jgi:hypothetical protein